MGLADRRAGVEAVREVLRDGAIRTVFQPVVRLDDDHVVGYEALARFDALAPDRAFAVAAEAGLGTQLELLAVRRAFEQIQSMPDDTTLGVNVGAGALLDPAIQEELLAHADGDICVEITEHHPVPDYPALLAVTRLLRAAGVLIVVDDAGAGYAGLTHIVRLRPDIIKLDISLTRDVDTDPVRTAMARALTGFASEVGSRIVAEGVETRAEWETLRDLGVDFAQGYYLAKPGPLPGTCR